MHFKLLNCTPQFFIKTQLAELIEHFSFSLFDIHSMLGLLLVTYYVAFRREQGQSNGKNVCDDVITQILGQRYIIATNGVTPLMSFWHLHFAAGLSVLPSSANLTRFY